MNVALLLPEMRARVMNAAISDEELLLYLQAAAREVDEALYASIDAAINQVLDSACHMLLIDNKFPETQSLSQGGASVSFATGDAERFRRRMAARREAAWMR